MPPKSSAPHNRGRVIPSDMRHFDNNLPVWKEKWFRNIPVDQSQPMKGEMKAQAHSTDPEYQVPFDNPSPGESRSPTLGNGTSLGNIVAVPDERHLPDSVDDMDTVHPSNAAHALSDAQLMSLLGVTSPASSSRSNYSRKGSPLSPTPSSGVVPLYPQATTPDGKPQGPCPYLNATDPTYNSSFDIFAPTPGPLFQQGEPQLYSDVVSIVQYPAGSEIYVQGGPTDAPAATGHQSFPDTPIYYGGYQRSSQRAYPSRARPYPPFIVSRGVRHMTRTDRSFEPSDRNSHMSGAQQYHPYSRCAQQPQDAEHGYTPRAVLNGPRTPEIFVNSPSPFHSSTNDGGLLYQSSQQYPTFPDPELYLGDFSNCM